MGEPLTTKLCVPPLRSNLISRQRLIERINSIQERRLFLISAPAGFGKTTLITEWISITGYPVAWLSLDEGDSDLARFLSYFVYALQNIIPDFGEQVLGMLASPQPLDSKLILTNLLNEIARFPENIFLVLDDYHEIEEPQVDDALAFLLENLPFQLHLIITTREDPQLPLARLRTRNQMAELRSADLRFTPTEAANFLNDVMDLELSPDDISALESRTEGWVAGLQLAGISMQGIEDKASFIQSFTGSHQFVMDFLVEEVLENQSESVKSFLLQTSILKRLCGPLCDAVLDKDTNSGQKTLEYLEQNNLFLIPLDNERRWYRYHHLFADILKQRLAQSSTPTVNYDVLHTRASVWFENNGLEIEAFEHAVAANDLERAERIVEGDGIPLHFRGKGSYVLRWLESLPRTELTTKPSLQVMYASALLFVGRHTAVEQELQIAEASLQAAKENDKSRDLIGRIAAIRATLAVISNDVETIIAHALHAQEHLHANNKLFRSIATWSLGVANQFTGDSQAASEAFEKTIAIGGKTIYTIAATINLGLIQEKDTKLSLATTNFKNAIEMGGDPPQLITCEAYLGLARIYYEFNNFDSAQKNAQQGLHLMEQMEKIDSFASYGILLSKLLLARGDISGAVNILNEAEVYVLNHNFEFRMPDVAAAQVLALLPQGDLTTAANLAKKYELPFSLARVHLAEGDPNAALAVLEPLHQQMDTTVWRNEQLKMMILTAVAHYHQGNKNEAVHTLGNAMALTEREGYIRSFVDEGKVMEALLSEAIAQGVMPGYSSKLLEVIKSKKETLVEPPIQPLINPLSKRELEILALIAAGLKNKEIAEKLFVSINTILYHTKNIYNKLGVNKRTLAILKARELNLLQEE